MVLGLIARKKSCLIQAFAYICICRFHVLFILLEKLCVLWVFGFLSYHLFIYRASFILGGTEIILIPHYIHSAITCNVRAYTELLLEWWLLLSKWLPSCSHCRPSPLLSLYILLFHDHLLLLLLWLMIYLSIKVYITICWYEVFLIINIYCWFSIS